MSRHPNGVRRTHYACPVPGGGLEPACSPTGVEKDPTKYTVTPLASQVDCAHCLRWLKGDTTPGCCATVATLEGAEHFSMQRIIIYNHKRCDRKAKVKIGTLTFCGVHQRLTREGFVDEQGNVADHSDIASARRYPEKFQGGLYSWHRSLPDVPVTKEKS